MGFTTVISFQSFQEMRIVFVKSSPEAINLFLQISKAIMPLILTI